MRATSRAPRLVPGAWAAPVATTATAPVMTGMTIVTVIATGIAMMAIPATVATVTTGVIARSTSNVLTAESTDTSRSGHAPSMEANAMPTRGSVISGA